MNPPYDGNLHLKILDKVLNEINEEDEVVNLSPIRWLEDPLAEYKKSDYKKFENIRNRIESIEKINASEANNIFNIGLLQPLGIYKLGKGGFNTLHNEWYQKVIKQIINENNYNKLNVVNYTDDLDNYVCLNVMAPPMKYGKPMYDWLKQTGPLHKNGYKQWKDSTPAATRGDVYTTKCVKFNTWTEAENCYNAMQLKFSKWLCSKFTVDVNVYPQYAPWLSDYTHPWTDEMLYKYFELTPEEVNIIETEMAQIGA